MRTTSASRRSGRGESEHGLTGGMTSPPPRGTPVPGPRRGAWDQGPACSPIRRRERRVHTGQVLPKVIWMLRAGAIVVVGLLTFAREPHHAQAPPLQMGAYALDR